nr:ethylene-responsive transcription factor ERF039-like [Ipomoea trifida]
MEELNPLSSSAAAAAESATTSAASDDLGEIIQLPNLDEEGSFDSSEPKAAVDRWVYPPWWLPDDDLCGNFLNEPAGGETVNPASFETLNWAAH